MKRHLIKRLRSWPSGEQEGQSVDALLHEAADEIARLVSAIWSFQNNTDSGEDEYNPFVSDREKELLDAIKNYTNDFCERPWK